jgi:hypothetical protein
LLEFACVRVVFGTKNCVSGWIFAMNDLWGAMCILNLKRLVEGVMQFDLF